MSARKGTSAPCGTKRLCVATEVSVQVLYYHNDNTPGERTHKVWHTYPGEGVSIKIVPSFAVYAWGGLPPLPPPYFPRPTDVDEEDLIVLRGDVVRRAAPATLAAPAGLAAPAAPAALAAPAAPAESAASAASHEGPAVRRCRMADTDINARARVHRERYWRAAAAYNAVRTAPAAVKGGVEGGVKVEVEVHTSSSDEVEEMEIPPLRRTRPPVSDAVRADAAADADAVRTDAAREEQRAAVKVEEQVAEVDEGQEEEEEEVVEEEEEEEVVVVEEEEEEVGVEDDDVGEVPEVVEEPVEGQVPAVDAATGPEYPRELEDWSGEIMGAEWGAEGAEEGAEGGGGGGGAGQEGEGWGEEVGGGEMPPIGNRKIRDSRPWYAPLVRRTSRARSRSSE